MNRGRHRLRMRQSQVISRGSENVFYFSPTGRRDSLKDAFNDRSAYAGRANEQRKCTQVVEIQRREKTLDKQVELLVECSTYGG